VSIISGGIVVVEVPPSNISVTPDSGLAGPGCGLRHNICDDAYQFAERRQRCRGPLRRDVGCRASGLLVFFWSSDHNSDNAFGWSARYICNN
jgi:hypothetical protein